MGFNLDEMVEIKKATSGFFKKSARKLIACSLLEIKTQVDNVKQLEGVEREKVLKGLLKEAAIKRRQALQYGAKSYGGSQWASAAACESWLLELSCGTPESIAQIEVVVEELIMRVPSSDRTFGGREHHPWRRFFARVLDTFVFSIIVIFLVAFILSSYPEQAKKVSNITESIWAIYLVITVLNILIESIFLSRFGATPVKWVFGISVKSNNGSNLSFHEALHRSVLVWVKGLGLGIPIVQLITMNAAYKCLLKSGRTSWDREIGIVIQHQNWSAIRVVLITIFTIVVFILMSFFQLLQQAESTKKANEINIISHNQHNSGQLKKVENNIFKDVQSTTEIKRLPIKIMNSCEEIVNVALLFYGESNEWITSGWYVVQGNNSAVTDLQTEHNKIYVYARSNTFTWQGDSSREDGTSVERKVPHDMFSYFDGSEIKNTPGETVKFTPFNAPNEVDKYVVKLFCDSVKVNEKPTFKPEKEISNEIPKKEPCFFKGVMTNKDLIACGITPH